MGIDLSCSNMLRGVCYKAKDYLHSGIKYLAATATISTALLGVANVIEHRADAFESVNMLAGRFIEPLNCLAGKAMNYSFEMGAAALNQITDYAWLAGSNVLDKIQETAVEHSGKTALLAGGIGLYLTSGYIKSKWTQWKQARDNQRAEQNREVAFATGRRGNIAQQLEAMSHPDPTKEVALSQGIGKLTLPKVPSNIPSYHQNGVLAASTQCILNTPFFAEEILETIKNYCHEKILFGNGGAKTLLEENIEILIGSMNSHQDEDHLIDLIKDIQSVLATYEPIGHDDLVNLSENLDALIEKLQQFPLKNIQTNEILELAILLKLYSIYSSNSKDISTHSVEKLYEFLRLRYGLEFFPSNSSECDPLQIVAKLAELINSKKVKTIAMPEVDMGIWMDSQTHVVIQALPQGRSVAKLKEESTYNRLPNPDEDHKESQSTFKTVAALRYAPEQRLHASVDVIREKSSRIFGKNRYYRLNNLNSSDPVLSIDRNDFLQTRALYLTVGVRKAP